MKETASLIIILLAVTWTLQYGLSFWQLRRFYKRVHELRRYGSVWIGKYGSAWKGREFAVVAVNKARIITHVEKFGGWTVLAKLEPVDGLDGKPIADIMDDSIELPVSKKFLGAMRNAIQFILDADAKAAARVKEKEEVNPAPDILEKSSSEV